MAACPWCKATMTDPGAPCPKCGRKRDDAAGTAAGNDVPELNIQARPSRAMPIAKPVAATAAAAPAKRASAHGVLDDPGARNLDVDDSEYGDNVSLDLDLSHGPPMISAQPSMGKLPAAPPMGSIPASKGPAASGATSGEGISNALQHPASPPSDAPIDPYEARALSDYGEPPEQWWKTPLYAWRVLRRRPEVKKRAAQKRREADRARGQAEDALMAFAEVVRPQAEKLAAYGPILTEVRGAEKVVRDRDAVLAAEADAHKARQAQHDARISELEADLSQIQLEERQVSGELAEADALTKRAEARVKRVEIEMRNAIAQAGGDGGGDGVSDAKGPA